MLDANQINQKFYQDKIKKYKKQIQSIQNSDEPCIIAHQSFLIKKCNNWIKIYNGYLIAN